MPYDQLSAEPQRSDSIHPELAHHVEQGAGGLLWFAYPWVGEALQRLERGIERSGAITIAPGRAALERMLVPQLLGLLQQTLEQTMVLELNVARVQELLHGETPAERFRNFCERLRKPDVRASIELEYPLLVAALITLAASWVDSTLELLQRLSADWSAIRSRLLPGAALHDLASIRLGAGDPHRGGRTVAILEFESGEKLVYKPHSQAIDACFGELLEWINDAGFATPFRKLEVIDRGDYGWSEHAAHAPCSSTEEVARFYHRLGGYLAIFYVLRARDMHFENLIAVGEHPFPIDLETLFHNDVTPAELGDPAIEAFQTSVMQTMLLPQPMYVGETDEVIDMSAFGAFTGQSFPLGRKPMWQDPGTDEMRLVSERVMPTMVVRSRPQLAGRDVDAREYQPEFLAGFRSVYRLHEVRRDELLSAGGVLERFAQNEVRYVPRATATYAGLLARCAQPDQLRSSTERDRVLQRLWLDADEQPHLRALVPAELRDLARGDVPLLTSRPDSTELWSSDGACLPGVFQRSSLALVHEGLRRMGDADLALQERLIRTAIASSAGGQSAPRHQDVAPQEHDATEPRGALDAARAIGDRLCREAIESGTSASWLGATALGPDGRATIQPLDVSLYGGLSGCALFLAHLGARTGEATYERVSHKALSLVRRHLDRGVPANGVGGFTGLGGIIYTLCQLSALWNDAELLDAAHGLARTLPALLDADRALDVIGGAAGAIAALRVLNGLRPSEELLQIAVRCGVHLLMHQAPSGGWHTDAPATQPLTGFSHGASGIAWALLKLAAWSGEERFRRSAEAALAYERSVFLVDHANWPDFRTLGTGGRASVRCELAWCHGAPGIALARIDSLAHCDDVTSRHELRTALEQTLASPFGRHACLCHGDLGNLDILLYASEQLHDPSWAHAGRRLAKDAVNAVAEREGTRAEPTQLTNPGLMVGLAGLGYGLLRLADPKRVPSVLVLAPPR